MILQWNRMIQYGLIYIFECKCNADFTGNGGIFFSNFSLSCQYDPTQNNCILQATMLTPPTSLNFIHELHELNQNGTFQKYDYSLIKSSSTLFKAFEDTEVDETSKIATLGTTTATSRMNSLNSISTLTQLIQHHFQLEQRQAQKVQQQLRFAYKWYILLFKTIFIYFSILIQKKSSVLSS